jgi:hypothetical protein
MKNHLTLSDFELKIQTLEVKKQEEWLALKLQFSETYESLKPINLLKSSLNELIESSDLQTEALNASIGFASGYLAKKMIVGESDSFISSVTGNMLELFVANKVYRNVDQLKSIGTNLFQKILQGFSKQTE